MSIEISPPQGCIDKGAAHVCGLIVMNRQLLQHQAGVEGAKKPPQQIRCPLENAVVAVVDRTATAEPFDPGLQQGYIGPLVYATVAEGTCKMSDRMSEEPPFVGSNQI